jgi:hypothetical protein
MVKISRCRRPASLAATAEEQALQVVLVHAVAGTPPTADVQHLLDSFPQRHVDDRLVPTCESLAVVVDGADVIGVPQHLVQLVERHRLLRPLGGRPSGQSLVGHGLLQPVEGVVAGGVELEGLAHHARCSSTTTVRTSRPSKRSRMVT